MSLTFVPELGIEPTLIRFTRAVQNHYASPARVLEDLNLSDAAWTLGLFYMR